MAKKGIDIASDVIKFIGEANRKKLLKRHEDSALTKAAKILQEFD